MDNIKIIPRKTRDEKQKESDLKYFKRWLAWLETQDALLDEIADLARERT